MKKLYAAVAIGSAAVIALAGCGGDKKESIGIDKLVSDYGYQWEDTNAPILSTNEEFPSFKIYSSKNVSAMDYNDLAIMQTLYEQTNVPVGWVNVSESVYGQQKNLILGDHEGYDAIYHAGMSSGDIITYGVRSKDLLPINEYLDYMPNFAKILEDRPDIRRSITSSDGNIYSLPRIEEMGLLQNPNLLFLNKNWTLAAINAGAAGLSGINAADVKDGLRLTSDQMAALLTYFRDNDMNGNGNTKDERPLTFAYNNWQGNQYDLYGMFGINDNLDHRIIKDGQVTYTVLDENYMAATNLIHDWLEGGLIDQGSLEISQNDFISGGKDGTEGVEKYGAFYWWESETIVSHPENYICCQPLVGPTGKQTVSIANSPEVSSGEVVIFSDCSNAEVLLTYFDRYYMPEISAQINYGPIGIAFEEEKDENGMLVAKDPPAGKTTDEIRLENAPLGICYLSDYAWEHVVNMEPRAKLRKERLEAYATPFYDATKVSPVPNLPFTSAEISVITTKESTLNTTIRTNLLNFLRNGVSQSDWDAFINLLNSRSGGLNEVQQVYQAAYDRYLESN